MMRINLNGVHYEIDSEIKDYVDQKIGKLDTFIPEMERNSARGEVKLKGSHGKGKQEYTCEAIVHMPHFIVTVHKTASSMKAAIDTVEDNLKIQLHRRKERKLALRRRRLRVLFKN